MRVSVFQHADNEGPGEIGAWAQERGHAVSIHHLYRGDPLPGLETFDLLVVMGGGMNIYQYRDYPWLKPERDLIAAALEVEKRVVGICLGSQLLADALGAKVVQNAQYELGWLPVEFTGEGRRTLAALPERTIVFHWHGDTFNLPAGAVRLGRSAGCGEQGFWIEGKCLALQFHFETNPELVAEMMSGDTAKWPKGVYVQGRDAILAETGHFAANRKILFALLDEFCAGMA